MFGRNDAQKNIEIVNNLELKSIKDQRNLVFQKCDYSETSLSRTSSENDSNDRKFSGDYDLNEISEYSPNLDANLVKMDYDFLFVQPNYRLPSVMNNDPSIGLDTFDPETMQNRNYWNIFGTGNLLHGGSGIDAILEQTFVSAINLNTQAKIDQEVMGDSDF